MWIDPRTFLEMPKPAKSAVVATVLTWCWFLFTVYRAYDPGALPKFLAAGAILCLFLVAGRNWARVLSLVACAFIILYCGFFTAAFLGADRVVAAMSALNVVLAASSGWFLLRPATAAFFREKSPAAGREAD